MEIFPHKELHWILKLTFTERQEIFRIATLLKARPTELIRDIIVAGLEKRKTDLGI